MEIETKNASIDTLSVTIQALCVSGKQMTLAVFRQLPQAEMLLETGDRDVSLKWWGIVRYPIKEQGEVWLVAEKGGRLYRCAVREPCGKWFGAKIASLKKDITTWQVNPSWAGQTRYVDGRNRNLGECKRLLTEWEGEVESVSRGDVVKELVMVMPQLFIAI